MRDENADTIEILLRNERRFARNGYKGDGRDDILLQEGTIPVLVSAPHAVTQLRQGKEKKAEILTGSLALLLGARLGAHVICKTRFAQDDPNFDAYEDNSYQQRLCAYVREHGIRLVIDIHGASVDSDFAIDIGTGSHVPGSCPSLLGRGYLEDLAAFSFEYAFRGLDEGLPTVVGRNRKFSASLRTTVTASISARAKVPCMQLEINRRYRDVSDPRAIEALLEGFDVLLGTLANVNSGSDCPKVMRLCQAVEQVPQDVVYFTSSQFPASSGGVLRLTSRRSTDSLVHARTLDAEKARGKLRATGMAGADPETFVFVTNRIIKRVCGQSEWNDSGFILAGMPVLVYDTNGSVCSVRVPVAQKVDRPRFSHDLYESILRDLASDAAHPRQVALYNRLTDAAMVVDMEDADYGQGPNQFTQCVYVPFYFRKLLGIGELPLREIRSEEFERIVSKLPTDQASLLKDCYEKSSYPSVPFVQLKESLRLNQQYNDTVTRLCEIQGHQEEFKKSLEVVLLDSETTCRTPMLARVGSVLLDHWVGSANHLLSVTFARHTADDAYNIARLSPDMMKLEGIEDNDKVIVSFGNASQVLRALADEGLEDMKVSLPAEARRELGMDSVNDVVAVRRDEGHIFAHCAAIQIVAVLGTLLAIFQVWADAEARAIACVVLVPVIMYFALYEERVRVR